MEGMGRFEGCGPGIILISQSEERFVSMESQRRGIEVIINLIDFSDESIQVIF